MPTDGMIAAPRDEMSIFASGEWVYDFGRVSGSCAMAIVDHSHRSDHDTNVCAFKFCLTWIGFFAAIGVFTYLVSLL